VLAHIFAGRYSNCSAGHRSVEQPTVGQATEPLICAVPDKMAQGMHCISAMKPSGRERAASLLICRIAPRRAKEVL